MYHCTNCDAQFLKWSGRCTECGKWGTLTDEGGTQAPSGKKKGKTAAAGVVSLKDVKENDAKKDATHIGELDRVLSGGFVKGQVLLLAGEPGIGKSTLLATVADAMKGPVLYVAGEESPAQLKIRFDRLGVSGDNVKIATSTNAESVCATIQKMTPSLVIVDSIQTMTTSEHDGAAGAPTHLRAATAQLTAVAKQSNIPVILVGQITKDGNVAGPKMLEHMVDTVLYLSGDLRHAYRLMRATKHRFGSTDEVGVFEMTEKGLVGVDSPSDLFMSEQTNVPGTAITCTLEGSRAFLIEIQALVNTSSYGTPVRRAHGFPTNRMQMLLAIVEKHGGVSFGGQDVYINVVGGMQIREPAVDLAVCAALMSSSFEKALPEKVAFYGEVGLGGEVRSVSMATKRAKEIERLGMKAAISSKNVKNVAELARKLKK